MKRLLTFTVLAILTLTAGVASGATLKPISGGGGWNSSPIFATGPKDDSGVFVVERGNDQTNEADIRIVKNGVLQAEPFLTVPNVDANPNTERGLLSMAFAPDYAASGLFYVFWIADGPDALNPAGVAGDIRIVEFKRSATDPDKADPASARLVLETPHDAGNHNGGWMGFGPDGHLYFTIGDNGRSTFAPDLDTLYGKVSRIDPTDPDGAGPLTATIPADNPFIADPGVGNRDEIYARGLRNPYRGSFAPNGNLTIGDVGNGQTEEVDVGNLAGKNLGWPGCEGFCDPPNPAYYEPFFTYEHDNNLMNPAPGTGNVIIGGYVVRDPDLTGLTGRYLYGDNQRTDLRTLNLSVPGGDPVNPDLSVDQFSLLSFGEDSRGCTYVMADSTVYRVAANAAATADCPHEADLPDPPDPEVDTTRPGLDLGGKAQRLGKKIAFFATCEEKCTIAGKGAVKAKRRGLKKAVGFKYNAASRSAPANTRVKVVLKLKTKALRNARRVFRGGRKLRATLVATAADPSGNQRSVKLRLKIKRRAAQNSLSDY